MSTFSTVTIKDVGRVITFESFVFFSSLRLFISDRRVWGLSGVNGNHIKEDEKKFESPKLKYDVCFKTYDEKS